jgi:CheY-like chemotaxis protein
LLSGRPKLLLADDSPTIHKVVGLTFEDEGLEVIAAANGEQALRLLEEQTPPDIILADACMPGVNGYELCERVKRDVRFNHIPVILLVGTFEPFNEAEARRVGADTVLTKPFQSIRDLVSKVGSLLGGGGESKHEEEATPEPPRRAEAAEDVPVRRADFPLHRPEAVALEDDSSAERGGGLRPDHAASFADLGEDDELIEATPAEAFGHAVAREPEVAPPHEHAAAATHEHEAASTHEHAAAAHASGGFSDSTFVARAQESGEAEDYSTVPFDAPSFAAAPYEAEANVMAAQPSFAAHMAGASAADDALLDLGNIELPASDATAEADDFILDLEDDLSAPPSSAGRRAEFFEDSLFDEPARERMPADAPSAFAEAAHGEPDSSFTPFEFSPSPAASAQEHDAPPLAEAVMQDEPQDFVEHDAPSAMGSAPRGFVEPSVVPADEPVPATFESEFTDGSVEGDVSKAPAGGFVNAPAAESSEGVAREMGGASEAAAPSEPSTAGYAVGEAHVGLAEPLRPDQFSREAVETIARRVVELMSDKVVREIAWEVVPELAELLIKQRLDEEKQK